MKQKGKNMLKPIKREPSIHISESRFKIILKASLANYKVLGGDYLVEQILLQARKHSLTNRVLLATNQKNRKASTKLVQSTLEDARLFSKTLLQVRRQLHHRGVVQIKEDSKDWLLIKQITELALAFSEAFNLSKEQGFKHYISIALKKLNLFALTRFMSLHEIICKEYEAFEMIQNDPHPNATKEAINYYSSILLKKTGEAPDYYKLPEKHRYFINLVDEASIMNVSIKVYIDAQFHAFNWKQAVPEISQMVGPKAYERVTKYMYEHDIKVGKTVKAIDFSKVLDRHANRD